MNDQAEFAVVRHDYISGHSYSLARLVDVNGVAYGLPIFSEDGTWQKYSRKPDAFKAAKALGRVRRDMMRESRRYPVMHALV